MNTTRPDALRFGLIGLGGAFGTLGRYELSVAAPTRLGTFPATTLAINVVGSLLLGLLLGTLGRHRPDDTMWRPLVGVGVLGGFTTFSTFAVESVQLARHDHPLATLLYVSASIGLGLLAARGGEHLAGASPGMIVEDEA